MKAFFYATIVLAAVGGCHNPANDNAGKREIFNAGNLHIITTFGNRKQQTMSLLYGNAAAKNCALSGYTSNLPGEVFTLVTYKQADSKFWYGSYINAAVKSVETVTNNNNQLTYKLIQGQAPVDSFGHPAIAANRIAYILSHKPSVFP